jgi:molybdopterin synthase catalytic subunit
MAVRVQQEDFDAGAEIQHMRLARADTGALAMFIGQVRDLDAGQALTSMTLEHYPGMTERSLQNIIDEAHQRWRLHDALIIHRYGELKASEQIVLVLVASAHRQDAFAACEFMMDYLKTEAPFWKKESNATGSHWVEAKDSDQTARERWQK